MTIWGNHSATQYPDLFHCNVNGENAAAKVGDQEWLENTFIPTVQQRGAAIIEARGASSAASAANAAIDTVRSLVNPTPEGDWNSLCVASDGSYDTKEGLITSFPVRSDGNGWEIVQDVPINDFAREKIDASVNELAEERELVGDLLPG